MGRLAVEFHPEAVAEARGLPLSGIGIVAHRLLPPSWRSWRLPLSASQKLPTDGRYSGQKPGASSFDGSLFLLSTAREPTKFKLSQLRMADASRVTGKLGRRSVKAFNLTIHPPLGAAALLVGECRAGGG